MSEFRITYQQAKTRAVTGFEANPSRARAKNNKNKYKNRVPR
jgi:hypothetical protein